MNMFETDHGARLLQDMTTQISRVADEISKANKMKEAELLTRKAVAYKSLWGRIVSFVSVEDFSGEIVLNQLHSLWVAFCICVDYAPDTGSYDQHMIALWEVLEKNTTNPFRDFESFDAYMCVDLV